MSTVIDYADTQDYLRHFRDKGCQADIVDNTEGLINLFWLNVDLIDQFKRELDKKTVTIVRLKEMISGMNSTARVTTDGDKVSDPTPDETINPKKKPAKTQGHGRHGVNDYPGAQGVVCKHDTLKAGDICPQCRQEPLRIKPPKIRIQIDGHSPLYATRYELEQLECITCLFTCTASGPVDLTQKYTPKAKATLAYLHYGRSRTSLCFAAPALPCAWYGCTVLPSGQNARHARCAYCREHTK